MSDVPMKKCSGPCGQEKPSIAEFWHRNKKAKDGLSYVCKKCMQDYHKQRTLQPEAKQRRRAYMKEYCARMEVKQHRKEYSKEYYGRSGVYEKHKEHIRARYRDPEERERILEHQKEYRSLPEAQELRRIRGINYRARKKSLEGAHSLEQIQEQLKRQKYKCYYCQKKLEKAKGRYVYHIEHTFPLSRVVGTDIPANSIDYLVLACPTCNISKGDKFPWEWAEGGRLF